MNFEEIKQQLSIEKVLQEYGMLNKLKKNHTKLYGKCPIHKGDNPGAFHVSLDKNHWNCFTHCGGGSVIDLLMNIEKINAHEAAILGNEMLNNKETCFSKPFKSKFNLEKKVNPLNREPLKFKLSLEHDHPYLKKRNITHDTAMYFGIGYCNKGIMSNRIAIPIYDLNNNLVAYSGRAIDDTKPKYFFPYGFEKSKIVYNLNRIKEKPGLKTVIVEGFFDTFALHRAGIDSVALMGCSLSDYQKQQLENLDKKLVLMLDGDPAGRRGMEKALYMLKEKSPQAIYLPNNLQLENLKSDYLKELIY